MLPYLFFHNKDNYINNQSLEKLKLAHAVHYYHDNMEQENYILNNKLNNNEVYMYCFTQKDVKKCLELGYIPHICFRSFDDELFHFNDYNYEKFWFPDEYIIDKNIHDIVQALKEINTPLCISFSPIFQPHIKNFEICRAWQKNIYKCINNPLLLKEMTLLDEEKFSSDNMYMVQNDNMTHHSYIILAIVGDLPFPNMIEFKKYNISTLLKQKECQQCEYQDYCIERGLGYIMHKLELKGCIGIKILQP